MTDITDQVALFIRIDVAISGAHDEERYTELSERAQDLIQESFIQEDQRDERFKLKGMTCRALGPLTEDDLMENAIYNEDYFRPLVEHVYDE